MVETNISVGILMGSDSDWPKIHGVSEVLKDLGVAHEVFVMSAHRTPEKVVQYASTAIARGIKIIIAAAGGAAHLAGTVAAHTTLPVIGIPVATELAGGLDSLLSTVQMPGDIPVATVGLGPGGARNAGILAAEILALSDQNLHEKLVDFRSGLHQKVQQRNERFQESLRDS